MTKTKTISLTFAAMASLAALAAAPQSAQAFGRQGIAVGEFNPSRGRFHDGSFRRERFIRFGFVGFRHFHRF